MRKKLSNMTAEEVDEFYTKLELRLEQVHRLQCTDIIHGENAHTKSIDDWCEYCVENYCADTPLPTPKEYKSMTKMQLKVAMLRPIPRIQT